MEVSDGPKCVTGTPHGEESPSVRGGALGRALRRVAADRVLHREADTMGFYVCVTLFAAMASRDDFAAHRPRDLVVLIGLSTMGLALAHWMALTVATQLVPDALEHHRTGDVLVAHLLLPGIAAVTTSIVVLSVPNDFRLLAGRLTAAALLAVLIGVEVRRTRRSGRQAMGLAALAFAGAAGIAVLKRLVF